MSSIVWSLYPNIEQHHDGQRNGSSFLHPAAHIFSGIVLGDIGVDNERLTEEISQLQPLLEYAQEVTVEAAVNEEPLSFDLCHHGRINATYF